MYFGMLLASGIFFVFIAFTLFLPVIVLVPQKFAICFTVGCGFIIGSLFALRGPKNQFIHMSSKEVSNYLYWINFYTVSECADSLTFFLLCFFLVFFSSEASFYIRVHWQHDGDHLCLHGAPQLYSICVVFCDSGNKTCALFAAIFHQLLEMLFVW